jgi:hypothetical protein
MIHFIAQFTCLGAVWVGIAYAFTRLMALYRSHQEGGKASKHFHQMWWNNNVPFYLGAVGTVVTLFLWVVVPTPAILLPDNFPTPEQRGNMGKYIHEYLHGTNAPAKSVHLEPLPVITITKKYWLWGKKTTNTTTLTKSVQGVPFESVTDFFNPKKPLPWVTKTWLSWFHLGWDGIWFGILTLVYLPFGLSDEFQHAFNVVKELISARKTHAEGETQRTEHHERGGDSGAKIFSWSFLAEIAGSFVFSFLEHHWGKK